jgi:hypothetical protein
MTTQHTSLVQALQMKPSSQKRSGRFIYDAKLKSAAQMSQASNQALCGSGVCSSFIK